MSDMIVPCLFEQWNDNELIAYSTTFQTTPFRALVLCGKRSFRNMFCQNILNLYDHQKVCLLPDGGMSYPICYASSG